MKEVVLADTATSKTIEHKYRKFDFLTPHGLGLFVGTVIPGIPAVLIGASTFGFGVMTFGSMVWVVSSLFGDALPGEIESFSGKAYSSKELRQSIPSGTRKKIGASKYTNEKELKPLFFSDTPKYRNYELQLFVRNDNGKLSAEYEITELPFFTWTKAYEAVLKNNNMEKPSPHYSDTTMAIQSADREARMAKEEYTKTSPGFSFAD